MSKLTSIPNFDCLYKNKSGSYFYNIQLDTKKPSGDFRRKLVKLDSKSLDSAIKDIRRRKLFLRFNNITKKQGFSKIRALESNLKEVNHIRNCISKLKGNIELFAWRGFNNISFLVNREIHSLYFEAGKIVFNPSWVTINSDITIIRKLRSFVKHGIR